MKTPEQFVNEECAVYNAEALVAAVKARDAEIRTELAEAAVTAVRYLKTELANDRAAFADIEDTGCPSGDHFSLRDRKKPRACPQVDARRRIRALDAILTTEAAPAVGPSDVLADARKALQDIRDLGGVGTAAQIARRYLEGHPLGSPVGPPETACGRCGFPLSPCHQGAPSDAEAFTGALLTESARLTRATGPSQKGRSCCAWHFTGGDGPQCLDEMV